MDTATYEKGKLYEINLDELQADPQQPRKSIDTLALGDSNNRQLHDLVWNQHYVGAEGLGTVI